MFNVSLQFACHLPDVFEDDMVTLSRGGVYEKEEEDEDGFLHFFFLRNFGGGSEGVSRRCSIRRVSDLVWCAAGGNKGGDSIKQLK